MPFKPKPLPAASLLREMFAYDPVTGVLTNRISRTSRKAGSIAAHGDRNGYLQVYAAGRLVLAHRVAWAIHYGCDPQGYIDHINGDTSDNRIANLRQCSHSQNMMNSKVRCHNRTGVAGVHLRADSGKWRAYISLDRKRINLGTFDSFEAAYAARAKAKEELHGEFARAAA